MEGRSKIRNVCIAEIFSRMGIIEQWGTGLSVKKPNQICYEKLKRKRHSCAGRLCEKRQMAD
ncbi:ATP-binding protein [Petralouisia muris]|uniref:ATP-binding protein n=1 Tax=Petralouisia muris TaxID=3032872 RepID=UPI0026BCEBE9